jgi:hypothetical protein
VQHLRLVADVVYMAFGVTSSSSPSSTFEAVCLFSPLPFKLSVEVRPSKRSLFPPSALLYIRLHARPLFSISALLDAYFLDAGLVDIHWSSYALADIRMRRYASFPFSSSSQGKPSPFLAPAPSAIICQVRAVSSAGSKGNSWTACSFDSVGKPSNFERT